MSRPLPVLLAPRRVPCRTCYTESARRAAAGMSQPLRQAFLAQAQRRARQLPCPPAAAHALHAGARPASPVTSNEENQENQEEQE